MEQLCRTYWYPLYAFIRREGHDEASAQDLTQAYFERFLEKEYLASVSREKGRFRSFLLASLKNFMGEQRKRDGAIKRGGGRELVSLDATEGEERYRLEPVDSVTAETLYERRWVDSLLSLARLRLKAEYAGADKAALHEALIPFEFDARDAPSYAEAARQTGKSESAIKTEIFRFRHRFHELVREEVTRTVGNAGEVDDEIRHLLGIIGS